MLLVSLMGLTDVGAARSSGVRKDYAPPKDAAAARDLDVKLKSWAAYLEKRREPTASTLETLKVGGINTTTGHFTIGAGGRGDLL